MQDYKTVSGIASSEFVEKRSRFISYISPAASEKEAIAFIQSIADMHREASHVVYAYSLVNGQIKRYSDAGEPQGTAGLPTLDVLVRRALVNTVIGTVRYFGGTLLGTGGLTRAYSKAAVDAASAALIVTRTWGERIQITLPYTLYGRVSPYIASENCKLISEDFGEAVALSIFVPEALCEKFIADITDICAGKAKIQKTESLFFDI